MYDQINNTTKQSLASGALTDELVYGIDKHIIIKWHTLLAAYVAVKPQQMIALSSCLHKGFLAYLQNSYKHGI